MPSDHNVVNLMDENKSKALQAALAQIEKQFGKGSIMRMDAQATPDVQVVSTGSLGLDLALGVGGLPRGRVVEIYGPESSGKTTLALHCVAEAQKKGGICAFVDAEHALDPVYARKLGVNVDDLLISQPDAGEHENPEGFVVRVRTRHTTVPRRVASSSGRSRTSCTLSADAMISTSLSAWRSHASRIMRPTRGSSGSADNSRPIAVSWFSSSTAFSSASRA